MEKMEFNKPYTVAQLFHMAFYDSAEYITYEMFFNLIIIPMVVDRKLNVKYSSTYEIRRIKKRLFE
jgi:hypothetical protein